MNILPYSGFPALPKNIEDMHNQLVTLGLNDVEALTARIKKCEDWVDTVEETELTGNPVEFQNALAVPAKSLETTINAIQDLHGYDKPWAGGANYNQWDEQWELGGISGTDGTNLPNTDRIRSKNYIPVVAGNTYYFTCKVSTTSNPYFYVCFYNSGKTFIERVMFPNNSSYTIPTGVAFIRFFVYSDEIQVTTYNNDIAINYPSTVTTYTPYSNICPISGRTSVTITDVDAESQTATVTVVFEDEHGDPITVFGGSLNLTTGAMTVDYAIVDMGTLAWRKIDNYNDVFYALHSDSKTGLQSLMCSIYKYDSVDFRFADSGNYDDNIIARNSSSNGYYVKDTSKSSMTGDAFKTAVTGQSVCYKLATPTTIQLTPEQLTMLKGYNRVSIEDGTITITAYTGGPWEPITRATKKKAKTKKSKKGGN